MTYGSRLRAEHELQKQGNFPYERKTPPAWVFDAIAERKLMGGFKKRNKCQTCFILLPKSEQCDYCSE